MMCMDVFTATEKGLHLENQDSFLANKKRGLFAVADGVTIAKGNSRIASSAAVERFEKEFAGDIASTMQRVHEVIKKKEGAGCTTFTVVVLQNQRMDVGHVGDSALFLVRERVRKITEEDRAVGKWLVQYMGKGSITPHLYSEKVKEGDVLVLATDGVWQHVSIEEIATSLKGTLEEAPKKLIEIAKGKKKLYEDDKTVVVVQV